MTRQPRANASSASLASTPRQMTGAGPRHHLWTNDVHEGASSMHQSPGFSAFTIASIPGTICRASRRTTGSRSATAGE